VFTDGRALGRLEGVMEAIVRPKAEVESRLEAGGPLA
jgi:hypothetical protein